MTKITSLSLLLFLTHFLFNCQTINKEQLKINRQTVAEAHRTGLPVYIKCSKLKQDGLYFIKTAPDAQEVIKIQPIGSNKSSYSQVWRIEKIIPLQKGQITDWPILYSSGTFFLKGSYNDIKDGFVIIKPANKTQMTLLDNSVMVGLINGYNLSNGEIVFKTNYRNYTITGDKILLLRDSGAEVKIILLDGSQRIGILTRDDGDKVSLKTIIGTEVFSRRDILKIEYQNTKK